MSLFERCATWLMNRMQRRAPDFVIGGKENPYLYRWWVIPRNRWFSIYLHKFMRSDDDRALHDHPWINCSILLRGSYVEHTIDQGGINHRRKYSTGDVRMRWSGKLAHRVEIDKPCWTLFIRGPVYRHWGFHCPAGWVPWEKFVARDDIGSVGKGCAQ